MSDLKRRSLISLAKFQLGMAVLLFLPAWSLHYWQAWLYWVQYGVTTTATTVYFLEHDPKVVERRLAVGPKAETEPTQKIIMTVVSACFVLLIVIPGLDHHFHWSDVPAWLAIAGEAGVLLGFAIIFVVAKENSFAAATIRVESEQPVISTGPYAIVRHPMYSGGLVMLGLTPLALGSYWGLLMIVPTFFGLAWRLLDEERYLSRNLPGYAEYCVRTRYRLIPLIW